MTESLHYFVIYGTRDLPHIRRLLLPSMSRQGDVGPRVAHFLNFEENHSHFAAEDALPDVKVVDHSSARPSGRLGYGGAINQLFEQVAPPDRFFIINPDTVLAPDFSRLLLDRLAQDRVGIAEARQWPSEHPKEFDPVTFETPWASGACLLVASQAFEEAGRFDPGFFLYCEDVDLSWRVWLAGWKVLYVPEALCEHHTGLFVYRDDRFYTEHYYSAVGFLLLAYKFFGDEGEEQALKLFHQVVGYPAAMKQAILDRYHVQKPQVTRVTDKPAHPRVRIEGYNMYHKTRDDFMTVVERG